MKVPLPFRLMCAKQAPWAALPVRAAGETFCSAISKTLPRELPKSKARSPNGSPQMLSLWGDW